MYIALKWLTALAVVQWLSLCCLDMYLNGSKKEIVTDSTVKTFGVVAKYQNVSDAIDRNNREESANWKHTQRIFTRHGMAFLHYFMFLAGAIAVLVFNKKTAIIKYTQNRIAKLKLLKKLELLEIIFGANNLNISPKHASVVLLKYLCILWGTAKSLFSEAIIFKKSNNMQKLNLVLLKRVKEIWQDRKTLGRLLLAAINDNKNIRMQCQLEARAKNRLVQYIQDTQKVIKENRTCYVNFQQLYLLTHRENAFLKNHIRKLTEEKDGAELQLMELINEVYRSQNNDLKVKCTRFIVHTKNNLLNSDVSAEIQKFLRKSQKRSANSRSEHLDCGSQLGVKLSGTSSLPEILKNDFSLERIVCDEPKLRGLPGECVWTVKDKNGLIERLYEYNFETDYDNGDTIRRIREYTVYHDKDCLLDHKNLLPNIPTCPSLSASATRLRLDINQRFLTGSQEFKTFIGNKPSIVPRVQAALPCG